MKIQKESKGIHVILRCAHPVDFSLQVNGTFGGSGQAEEELRPAFLKESIVTSLLEGMKQAGMNKTKLAYLGYSSFSK